MMSLSQLSKRRRQIAELVATGHTDKAIGAKLGISARTVEHHVAAIVRTWGLDGSMNVRILITRRVLLAA